MNLQKYRVQITETLQCIIEMQAVSLDDAINEVHERYRNQEIILDSNDYINTEIKEFSLDN